MKKKIVPRICPFCKTEFYPNSFNQKICLSRNCKKERVRKREKDRREKQSNSFEGEVWVLSMNSWKWKRETRK